MNKNFSIVLNYGCSRKCFFCAFKNHRLRDVHDNIDWHYLDWCISTFKGEKISISGGGDPLFELDNNLYTLVRIAGICKVHRKKLDIHTNEYLLDKIEDIKLLNLNQLVVSCNTISIMRWRELQSLLPYVKIRAVMVYLDQSTQWIRDWISFYSFVPHLTVRECWGLKTNFQELATELTPEYNSFVVKFLKDNDYNYYYMPDNRVYEDYRAEVVADIFKGGKP